MSGGVCYGGSLCRSDLSPGMAIESSAFSGDIPRKKSRNYLDSHKTIEKKRRDRINLCLNQLKSLVPDCRQYVRITSSPPLSLASALLQGNKKLDKAEILEMTIEHIQRLHQGGLGGGKGVGQLDLALGQKEWATDLTTWIIQNKILHTGEACLSSLTDCHSWPSRSTCSGQLLPGTATASAELCLWELSLLCLFSSH